MSTTQELIERLRQAKQTLADYEREGKAGGWVMTADLSRVTFDRLASLEAENAALKAKLAHFFEAEAELEAAQQEGNPGHRYASYARLREARAAIAAYLAAGRDGE